jgi:ubiquinone/menaquinone biosynthesis C-methylase UbiE
VNRIVFDIGALYYDLVTTRLPEWRADCRKLTEHLVSGTRVILDLGTGPGVSAYEIANSMPQTAVLGIDLSLTMIRRATRNRRRYGGCEGRVHFAQADAELLPLAPGSVDAITTHSFLYLVSNRRAVLDEIRRVLRSGGVAVFFEPRHERRAVPPILAWKRNPIYAWTMFLWGLVSRIDGAFREGELVALVSEAGLIVRHAHPALEGYGCLVVAEAPDSHSTEIDAIKHAMRH